jgi:MFS transporter, DHA2 family, methylenomycin A resistance protein
MTSQRRTLTLVVMCVGMFLVLLDVTVVNVALPRLRSDLGAGVASLQWIVDGYAVALASLMLPCGDLGDRHGHKRVVLAGLAAFGTGSLAAGLAPAPALLIAGRVVQGAGAAFLLPGTLAVISRAYPDAAERARAIGIWAAISSLALPAGVIAGGALVDGPGWRWAFLVNLPVVAVALPVTARVVHESREPAARAPDLPGAALAAALLATATFAIIAGSPAAGAAATALLAALVAVERRQSEPMLPAALFRRPAFVAANAVGAAMNLGTLGTLFVLTLFLQDVQDRSALGAGVALLPAFGMLAVVAPLSGRLVGRIGPRRPMVAGLLIAPAGLALLAHEALLAASVLWGLGLGLLTPAVVAAAMGAVPADRAGLAAAVNNTARQAGGAIGIAISGAVAGSPARAGFVHGFHTVALGAAGLYVAAAALASVAVPGRERAPARRMALEKGGDGARMRA